MTDIIDNNIASESSDNEEIVKLFPRCRPPPPKMSNDFNLNQLGLHGFDESNGNDCIEAAESNHRKGDYVNAFDMDCQLVGRKSEGVVKGESCHEDHSVVSAYDAFNMSRCDGLPKHDSTSDVLAENACGVSNFQEFKLRESRIEIAGGREVFSSSRARLPKKRYSDEILYHNPNASEKEMKRHSAEVTYEYDDDKFGGYRLRSSRKCLGPLTDVPEASQTKRAPRRSPSDNTALQHCVWENSDGVVPKHDSLQKHENNKDIVTFQGLKSGLVVYETPVRGSEVVYDDIGDWTDQLVNCSPSALDEVRDFSGKPSSLAIADTVYTENTLLSPRCNKFPPTKDGIQFVNGKLPNYPSIDSLPSPEQDDVSSSDDSEADTLALAQSEKATKLIGSIPIAEYEGSPRRYGPRPGHPERVITTEVSQCDIMELEECRPNHKLASPTKDGLGLETQIIASTTTHSNANGKEELCNPAVDSFVPESMTAADFLFGESSETQKVLEEFYKQDSQIPKHEGQEFGELEYKLYRMGTDNSYVGRRLAQFHSGEASPKKAAAGERCQQYLNNCHSSSQDSMSKAQLVIDSLASGYITNPSEMLLLRQHEDKGLLDPFDHDCETISTNPDTEDLAETEMGEQVGQSRNFTLSPETTDCDSNDVESEVSFENEDSLNSGSRAYGSMPVLEDGLSSGQVSDAEDPDMDSDNPAAADRRRHHSADNPTTLLIKKQISEIEKEFARCAQRKKSPAQIDGSMVEDFLCTTPYSPRIGLSADDTDLEALDPLRQQPSPPSPAPPSLRKCDDASGCGGRKESVDEAIKEIKQAILKSKTIPMKSAPQDVAGGTEKEQPIWIPRPLFSQHPYLDDVRKGLDKERHEDGPEDECDTDQETDRLLGKQRTEEERDKDHRKKGRSKEVLIHEPAVLIEGVLFRARYLGSTQLVCEGQPTKATRMMQAEEAVSRIKSLAPEGENQPSTEVDLFISTEKIMVLNTDLKEIMMDHSLRTISYIADIGDLVVLMARRRMIGGQEEPEPKRHTPKMICHVFESEEAQFIAQSIGQAFQVAYMEFLKANGIEDHSFVKEMDYQEVLNSQEIYGDELEMFAKKEMQKEVIVPKARGEILGVVIVESGWGSMLPTVVIANLSPNGAAARCGQLNIGDQIIAINGISLVGLPLSTCQHYIKNGKTQMVVKLTVVPCAPVVEVKIKRPDTKYQLGFSVQNGVICSLLRGGIAERGGVRVGHRIIEINGQSVVAVPHERIVNLLATSVGEILMKTMPTSMFRLLTGQETPLYI